MILLSLIGLTFIITESKIMQPVRDLLDGSIIGKLISCAQCTGFWVGVVYALIAITITDYNILSTYDITTQPVNIKPLTGFILLDGCLVSVCGWLIAYVFGTMDSYEFYIDKKAEYYESKHDLMLHKELERRQADNNDQKQPLND